LRLRPVLSPKDLIALVLIRIVLSKLATVKKSCKLNRSALLTVVEHHDALLLSEEQEFRPLAV
jgi:hypothetical protein